MKSLNEQFFCQYNATFGTMALVSRVSLFAGMAVADALQFSGIPDFSIYHQGQQVTFTGILEDGCSRRLPNGSVQLHADTIAISNMTLQADKDGIFFANFTIPGDLQSGRYKMELDGRQGNMTGKIFSTLLVEENNESNVPYKFEDLRLGTFVIRYHMDGGEIFDIGTDPIMNTMWISYGASHNGTLVIGIPPGLMNFIGTVNDTKMWVSGLRYEIKLTEHLDSQGDRVYTLPVVAGKNQGIEIDGITYGANAGYDRQGIIPIQIHDMMYPLPYNITNGALQISADPVDNALKLWIYTTLNEGHLRLVLPRQVIDSVNGEGKNQNFTVIYSKIMDKTTPVTYYESQTSTQTRTLEIDFGNGTNIMYIYGTYLVPEFPFAIPVLIVSITSLIIFYRAKFR